MNTELPSAANEGKLTEAEATALSEAVNLGLSRDSRIARDGVISRHVESLLAARLSAREPDNEALGEWVDCPGCRRVHVRPACTPPEVESLRRWKAEATQVLDEWDRVWDALGKPGALGSSRALSSLAAVERLLAVPVSGVPTVPVRELLALADIWSGWADAPIDHGPGFSARPVYRYCATQLRALVQRAAETNESGT